MVRYSLIVDYLDRGNNFSQVARLCCCSRMTVWRDSMMNTLAYVQRIVGQMNL
mgnify:CR=1 FL=1